MPIAAGEAPGMVTVLVGDGGRREGVDYQIRRITDLADLLDANSILPGTAHP